MKCKIRVLMLAVFLVMCMFATAGAEEYCDCEGWMESTTAYCNDVHKCSYCELKFPDGKTADVVYHYYSCEDPSKCKYCDAPYDYKQANTNDYLYGIVHEYGEYRYINEDSCAWSCIHCGAIGRWGAVDHYIAACTGCCVYCDTKMADVEAEGHWYTCEGVCHYCGEAAPEGEELPSHDYLCNGLCEECGKKAGAEIDLPNHSLSCDNPICEYCGETITDLTADNVYVYHADDLVYACEGDKHWEVCPDCDAVIEGSESLHRAHCSGSDPVCTECGAQILPEWKFYPSNHGIYSRDRIDIPYSEKEHRRVCKYCREDFSFYTSHYIGCDGKCIDCGYQPLNWTGSVRSHDPLCNGICEVCGVDTGEEGSHSWTSKSDEQYHWDECSVCGTLLSEKRAHYRYCDDGNECHGCGASYSGPAIAHLYEMYAYVDKDYCQMICAECGEVLGEKVPHTVWCYSKTNSCSLCGAYCENPVLKHSPWGGAFESDENYHWNTCYDCDMPIEKTPHQYYCGGENTCDDCERTGLTEDMAIHKPSYYTYKAVDVQYHQQICTDCGDVMATRAHVDNDGDKVCNLCGGSMVEREYEGTWAQDVYCATCGKKTAHTGKFDLDTHWGSCGVCGAEIEQEHEVVCKNKAEMICSVCGGNGVNCDYVEHEGEWIMLHDENYHWEACSGCLEKMERYYGHVGMCTAPNTCIYCGAQGIQAEETEHLEWERAFDDTHHWYYCIGCKEIEGEKSVHERYCDEDACAYCDQTNVTIEIIKHSYRPEYVKVDEKTCQKMCKDCGETFDEPIRHVAECFEPTVCIYCDATDIVAEISHGWRTKWAYDATHHWEACQDCGEKLEDSVAEKHVVSCMNDDACAVCGAKVDGETLGVTHENLDYFVAWDNTHHWEICLDCGQEVTENKERHERWCTSDDVCRLCGAEGVDCLVYHGYENFDDGTHNFEGKVYFDENGHWWVCPDCKDKTPRAHVFGDDQVCDVCAYEKPAAVPGDANGDGVLDSYDIQAVLKYVSGWGNSINTETTDMNDSGSVTTVDILMMLRKMNGGT